MLIKLTDEHISWITELVLLARRSWERRCRKVTKAPAPRREGIMVCGECGGRFLFQPDDKHCHGCGCDIDKAVCVAVGS